MSKLETSFQSSIKEREYEYERTIVDLKQKVEEQEEKIHGQEKLILKQKEDIRVKTEEFQELKLH